MLERVPRVSKVAVASCSGHKKNVPLVKFRKPTRLVMTLLLFPNVAKATDPRVSFHSASVAHNAYDSGVDSHRLASTSQLLGKHARSTNTHRFEFQDMQKPSATAADVSQPLCVSSNVSPQPRSTNVYSDSCVGRLGVGHRRVDSTTVLGEQAVAKTERPTHDETVDFERDFAVVSASLDCSCIPPPWRPRELPARNCSLAR